MPPRRPPRTQPWTREQVTAVAYDHLVQNTSDGQLAPFLDEINKAVRALAHLHEPTAATGSTTMIMAYVAIMDYLSDWALAAAQDGALEARAAGAAWADIAVATGFASEQSAANHFDAAKRLRRRDAMRLARSRSRSTDEV